MPIYCLPLVIFLWHTTFCVGETIISTSIDSGYTFTLYGSPYTIQTSVSISGDVTINAGVQIYLNNSAEVSFQRNISLLCAVVH